MIDRRLIPEETAEEARKEIEDVIEELEGEDRDLKVELRTVFEGEPARTPATERLPQTVTKNVKKILGKELTMKVGVAYADFRFFANQMKIPTVSYGPGVLKTIHSADEHVLVEDLVTATKVLALTYLDLLGFE